MPFAVARGLCSLLVVMGRSGHFHRTAGVRISLDGGSWLLP